MKISYFGILGFFAVVTLGCKSKSKQGGDAGVTEAPNVEIVGEVKKTEEVKKEKLVLSPEKRAEKTGFAKYLPADTEMLLSVYQATDSCEKALKLVRVMMDEKSRINSEVGLAEASPIWTLLGQEVTVAFGKTTGEQMGNLLKLNERVSFFQAAAIGKAVQTLMKNGNMEEFGQSLQGGLQEKSFMNFLEDPESGMSLLNKTAFPPMYIAFRAKEGELEQAARMVSSSMAFFGMAGEMAVPVEIQTAGSRFVGYKLLGAKLAEFMSKNREEMEINMKQETLDALLAALSKKNMVFATGTIGDYVVLMIGGDEASLQLVSETKDSLGADKKMSFVDEFSDKHFLTVSYGDQAALKSVIQHVGGVASYGLGFREGLSGGEMRDIQELLQLFAEREKALLALGTTDTFGMVAYSDEGLKIDSFGGHDKGAMDWSAPTRLAHLGDDPDHLFFLNYSSHAAYNAQLKEYLELIGETAYAMALKFSALEIEDPKILEMKGYLKLFDTDFREDMLALYQAASGDLMDGMGQETVFLMDMKGAMPALPGIPQEIVNEGKVPRLAMITPVTDRAKIAKSWDKINTHSTALLAKVSEMAQKKIPMQKPISSEKDGMVSWFVSMPFFQDDFLPSVTLNDKWFVASTSKVKAVDLIGKAEAGGESGQGVKFRMNFKVLGDYSEEMLKVMDRHREQLSKDKTGTWRDIFNAENNKDISEIMKMIIRATREFDSMTWDVRKEDGLVRSRIHFKMN